ncbi:helix-turn-helix domain-containing protein (plasmid) [Haloferax sp. S1W]|uniref:helix-turn-helix domain-containing protein n=1 Tax=Haloferax sp. S1W TaxID=3377110 RepID=UPI0037C8CF9D
MYKEDQRLASMPPRWSEYSEPRWSVEPIPDALSSSQTKLVYLYLSVQRAGTVDELRKMLGMKTITLYPVLEHLVDLGLVQRDDERYVLQPN